MIVLHILKWVGGLVLLAILIFVAFVALFGWNWLREPVAQLIRERTGRELSIGGDLQLRAGWPALHISSEDVKFGNPPWAAQKYMLRADGVDFSLKLPDLFARRLALEVLALRRARVFLEANADGQKNWLLDLDQKDEDARLLIDRLALAESRIAYDEPAQKTSIVAEVSTADEGGGAAGARGEVTLRAQGQYRGMPLFASGRGGSLLALRDERDPYPFSIDATIGRTGVRAAGSVTGLSRLTALDVKVAVHGDSLAQLFPLLGIALPETRAYRSTGHLSHRPGVWRYADFSARIGNSDLSGSLQVDTGGGRRPFLQGDLSFGKLEFSDLGPVVGRRSNGAPPPGVAPNRRRVLPDVPFRVERWDSVDADIKLSARTIIRPEELPIEQLSTRLRMRDAVLTLDPLEFGVAGGTLGGAVTLDGRHDPIGAQARLAARKIVLDRLFPTLKRKEAKLGLVSGELDLAGRGNSVARMLASASGKVGLVVAGGEVSKLAMEMAGLHVLEVIVLKVAGDRRVGIRCGIADFEVRSGVMQTGQLLFDTEISQIAGSGKIDFGQETLDLTLVPKSKETSLIALRSPIYVRGSFSRPAVDVDPAHIAARGLGALALAAVNPLLALAPLVEAGPGMDSDCGRLIRQAQ